jgi:hypothetical protein
MDVSENDRPSTAQINAAQQFKFNNSVANRIRTRSIPFDAKFQNIKFIRQKRSLLPF